jgi:hypothetical protein
MRRRGVSSEALALKNYWHRWVEIVERFALRRPSRRTVDSTQYRVLHKELTEKCRSLAASSNEVEATFYRYLEGLVQPWLTPAILARADREILQDLLARCLQAEQQLGGRRWARSIRRWALPLLLGFATVFTLVLGLFTIDRVGFPALRRLRDFSDDVWIAVTRSTEFERLTALGIVLLITSIIAVTRTAKS